MVRFVRRRPLCAVSRSAGAKHAQRSAAAVEAEGAHEVETMMRFFSGAVPIGTTRRSATRRGVTSHDVVRSVLARVAVERVEVRCMVVVAWSEGGIATFA